MRFSFSRNSCVAVFVSFIVLLMLLPACETVTPREKHFGQGEIYLRDGRYERAELEFSEVLALEPDNPEAEFNLGLIAQNQGDLEKAKFWYQKAIEHFIAKKKKSEDKSSKVYFTLEDKNNTAKAYVNLASIYWRQKNFKMTEEVLKSAAQYNEQDPQIFFNMGEAFLVQDKVADAEQAFKRSLEIKPDYANAHIELAFLYEEIGKIDKAKEHHSIARQLGKDDDYLVEKLDWWRNWKTFEAKTRDEPRVRFSYPPKWIASAGKARAGRVLVVFDDTLAVCYGEGEGSIQIVGPDKSFSYVRRGGENPYDYARKGLLEFLRTRSEFPKELMESIQKQKSEGPSNAGNSSDNNADDAPAAEIAKEKWIVNLKDLQSYTFHNGIIGATIPVRVVWTSGDEFGLNFWFYLGQESSFTIIGTRKVLKGKENEEKDNRTKHALAYIAKHFEVLPPKKK